eukprot:TRINITY_DN22569_c0_g5_i1.p1 TRINITY_DN22569_c0_g5~~TRINITY_DN22569_c0_g5_i1.p1  ORF type:complete len:149 (+),score=25.52 TRINITY_DN22569_c0_g5_i1:290-736(+)
MAAESGMSPGQSLGYSSAGDALGQDRLEEDSVRHRLMVLNVEGGQPAEQDRDHSQTPTDGHEASQVTHRSCLSNPSPAQPSLGTPQERPAALPDPSGLPVRPATKMRKRRQVVRQTQQAQQTHQPSRPTQVVQMETIIISNNIICTIL